MCGYPLFGWMASTVASEAGYIAALGLRAGPKAGATGRAA